MATKKREEIKFTVKGIEALKPREKDYLVRESAPRGEGGFCLRVWPSGAKTWLFVYTFHGRRKWFTIGDFPALPLAAARVKFQDLRRMLASGKDPGDTLRQAERELRESWTVNTLAAEFVEKYCNVRKRPRSAREDELNLARDVLPILGRVKARDIRRGDVVALLDDIVRRGSPVQANRTLATVRKMFNWALEREVVEFNPATGVSRPGGKERPKERTLDTGEISHLWQAIDTRQDLPGWLGKALKLTLLTGARPGEILNLRWEQYRDGWFDLGADDTKNGHPTRIYFPGLARRVLGEAGTCGLVFVKADGKPAAVYDLSAWLRRKDNLGLPHWRAHDLRRTCTTGLAGLGVAPHIIDKILNHVPRGVTERHYNKHTYGAEISAALEAWATEIGAAINRHNAPAPGARSKVIKLFG